MKPIIVSIPVTMARQGEQITVYLSVISDGENTFLVDCGYPGMLPAIESSLANYGIDPMHVSGIIITHHDYDHIGSLAAFCNKYPQAKVYASQVQAPYISGQKKSLRVQQFENMLRTVPKEKHDEIRLLIERHSEYEPVAVHQTVSDGTLLPVGRGVQIVETNGHMPGHICMLVAEEKTLIAGDALTAQNGVLCLPNPLFTLDMAEAKKSIRRLASYDLERVICYHGGTCTNDIASQMKKLV